MTLHADSDLRPKSPSRRPVIRLRRGPAHPARTGGHHRYSRWVGTLRLVLPSMAVVLLGLVVAWPQLSGTDKGFQLEFAKLAPGAVDSLSMVNARFFGLNHRNQPYTLTADVATEDEPGSGVIVLDAPKGDFLTNGGKGVYVEARRGFYRQKQQLLELRGEVALYHEDGYELHTEKADVNLKTSDVTGTAPVTGNGPQGRINGTGFRIQGKGETVMVTGQSKVKFKGAGSK